MPEPRTEHDRLLSPEAVARHVGLSRRAVYDAIRRGELRAMRLCGRLRISPDDLEAWMAGAVVTPPAPIPSVTNPRRPAKDAEEAGSFRALMAGSGERKVA